MDCCDSCSNGLPCESKKISIYLDTDENTLISVRDGVQIYSNGDSKFTVYRSPETIERLSAKMVGLGVVHNHIDDMTKQIPAKDILTRLESSEVVESVDVNTDTTICLRHKAQSNELIKELKARGVKELSLGYKAKTRSHDKYDFEQYDIEPHHLAIVQNGRCGDMCFLDSLNLNKKGDETMAEENKPAEKKEDGFEKKYQDMCEKYKDMESKYKDMEEKIKKFEDSESEEEQKKKEKEYQDSVNKAVSERLDVIRKAEKFLDSSENLVEMSSSEIIDKCLSKHYGEMEFSDSEKIGAFKAMVLQPKEVVKRVVTEQQFMDSVSAGNIASTNHIDFSKF